MGLAVKLAQSVGLFEIAILYLPKTSAAPVRSPYVGHPLPP